MCLPGCSRRLRCAAGGARHACQQDLGAAASAASAAVLLLSCCSRCRCQHASQHVRCSMRAHPAAPPRSPRLAWCSQLGPAPRGQPVGLDRVPSQRAAAAGPLQARQRLRPQLVAVWDDFLISWRCNALGMPLALQLPPRLFKDQRQRVWSLFNQQQCKEQLIEWQKQRLNVCSVLESDQAVKIREWRHQVAAGTGISAQALPRSASHASSSWLREKSTCLPRIATSASAAAPRPATSCRNSASWRGACCPCLGSSGAYVASPSHSCRLTSCGRKAPAPSSAAICPTACHAPPPAAAAASRNGGAAHAWHRLTSSGAALPAGWLPPPPLPAHIASSSPLASRSDSSSTDLPASLIWPLRLPVARLPLQGQAHIYSIYIGGQLATTSGSSACAGSRSKWPTGRRYSLSASPSGCCTAMAKLRVQKTCWLQGTQPTAAGCTCAASCPSDSKRSPAACFRLAREVAPRALP